ncbi:hypothetical protein IMZ29_10505 [Achromobacter sp. GG226]|nr:hypothetical protein [Verticiella sp. GG226]MBU4610948.1 hypothetical protein [Verticiella sp. GG226]
MSDLVEVTTPEVLADDALAALHGAGFLDGLWEALRGPAEFSYVPGGI